MRTAVLLALALGATTASADTIDFEDLACAGPTVERIDDVTGDPYVYTSGDYVLTETSLNLGFYRHCDTAASFPGSTAVFNNTVAAATRLERADGAPFSMDAIDLAELNGAGAVTVDFTGTTAAGATVMTSFTTDGAYPTAETFTFPSGWDAVVAVEWTQDAPFHQFDNLVVDGGGPSGPSLTFTGTCPGMITIDIAGLTPGDTFAAARSGSLGAFTIPTGGCAGTTLGLASPSLVGLFPTGSGTQSFMPSIGAGSCGDYVQVVDLATCQTTNVEQF